MNREMKRLWLQRSADIHRCPNNGRILESPKHDDKVLCGCGRPSPLALERVRSRPPEPPGTHIKALLPPATVEDYLNQEAADETKRLKKQNP